MVKRTDATSNWEITHTGGPYYNGAGQGLYANLTNVENAGVYHDILSNGFKVRTTDSDANINTATYIYAAFAEFPLKFSLAR